jgi:hypothetical protein
MPGAFFLLSLVLESAIAGLLINADGLSRGFFGLQYGVCMSAGFDLRMIFHSFCRI